MAMSKSTYKKTLHDQYLDGSVTTKDYVEKLLNGKEADRTRRKIEKKITAIVGKDWVPSSNS
ncbi:MAG: hypothetical protein H7X86_10310 [Gorillibacterium sp.]|nr:hypothetical protein [Gorillibacterium sp.]